MLAIRLALFYFNYVSKLHWTEKLHVLRKLITVNQPDLVLFVGEALVGNEAVDQLVKFNQALADFSHLERPRGIDGIVLTKFDTIDDKVNNIHIFAHLTLVFSDRVLE
ncbi:unnamed protein product [Protopolystoma xenopodis]|uniref:SRP54-type proteins GTP-binding domain-containing protein n=1 Tax=Protopolystoma xenopodis TaxID=117903 RepID=A0A3S5FBT0_9PLAT|nr:unnamed protein product [Protopolystoma xenopodis]